ncbi:hypothetical protein PLESTF_000366100 [Pleodorina starrii]|nr:hypothetical protein PLESTF_000366100 [Pleodorina starrii]
MQAARASASGELMMGAGRQQQAPVLSTVQAVQAAPVREASLQPLTGFQSQVAPQTDVRPPNMSPVPLRNMTLPRPATTAMAPCRMASRWSATAHAGVAPEAYVQV